MFESCHHRINITNELSTLLSYRSQSFYSLPLSSFCCISCSHIFKHLRDTYTSLFSCFCLFSLFFQSHPFLSYFQDFFGHFAFNIFLLNHSSRPSSFFQDSIPYKVVPATHVCLEKFWAYQLLLFMKRLFSLCYCLFNVL